LNHALQQSPTMLRRALDLEIAENSRIQARSAVLPSVSANASLNRSKDTNKYVYTNSSSESVFWTTTTPYAFSISQPVFHWGALRNTVAIGKIEESLAKAEYSEGYRVLAHTLRMDYMRLMVRKLSARRAAFYLEFIKKQLVLDEARLAKKEISDMQIAKVRLSAEQAQIAYESAQFDFETAKTSFARLSGMPVLSDEAIPEKMPVIPYTESTFNDQLAGFLSQPELPTTEAVVARKRLAIQKLSYASAKTRLRPKVNFSTGVSQNVQRNLYGTVDTYEVTSVYAGISVYWTIFDGLASGAATRSTLARYRQLEIDYKGLTERLAQQAQTQAKQVNFAARSMKINDRALTDSEGGLKARLEEFARGTVSEADVSLTRISVYDTEIYAYNSRIDYLFRVGEFLGTIVKDPVIANVAIK